MGKPSRRRARAKVRKQITQQRHAIPAARASTAVVPKAPPRARPTVKATPLEAVGPGAADSVHAILWRTGLLNVAAIARRELGALFVSPVGWVVAAVFTFLVSGFGFIAATYIGMLLVGAASIAIGVLASSLTKNQIIAYVVSLLGLLAIWYTAFLIGFFTTPPLSLFFDYVAGYYRYQSFSLGQGTLRDTVYFASLAAGALFLTTRLLESRRWR